MHPYAVAARCWVWAGAVLLQAVLEQGKVILRRTVPTELLPLRGTAEGHRLVLNDQVDRDHHPHPDLPHSSIAASLHWAEPVLQLVGWERALPYDGTSWVLADVEVRG